MNHTIKGILIVAAITSMLVVGASMVPIMQNSFAYKKSDFNRAKRDPNTNTDTNTNANSADSISSSSATASNENNITNSATSAQSQEQSACAVAVTCPEGSTTVTPTPPTSTCNPSTVGGITATPTDGTCTATILFSAGDEAVRVFTEECAAIPPPTMFITNDETSVTCIFPSTPPA
jgi:hypothetical protein